MRHNSNRPVSYPMVIPFDPDSLFSCAMDRRHF